MKKKQDKVSFAHINLVILFLIVLNSVMVYDLVISSPDSNTDFTFLAAKLTKNPHPDKYFYYRYGIGFVSQSLF